MRIRLPVARLVSSLVSSRLPSLLAGLALALGCHAEPAWTRAPADHPGDATVAGAPVGLPRLPTAPLLDGKLDDAAWTGAGVIGPLASPGDGAEIKGSPVAAFARMGWDDAFLYVGVVVRDRAPTSPFAKDDLDPHVWGASSGIELMLQPGDPGDNRDYYELQVDVNGAVFDSHFDDYNAPITGSGTAKIFGHQDWSSHVERAIFVERGRFYSIELKVPWSAFAPGRVAIPPHPGDVWRLNVYTFRDGQRQSLAWSPIRGQGNFHRSSRFGRIKFE